MLEVQKTVLDNCKDHIKLPTFEAPHILHQHPSMNRRADYF